MGTVSNAAQTACHAPTLTSSSLALGTRQMQLVAKLVSRVWMQRRQQRFS